MPNWGDVSKEIIELKNEKQNLANGAVDIVRRKYLTALFDYTKRNVIAYYSGFLSKPGFDQLEINDEDKNGFMMAIHKLDRSKGLDLILHTPGGSIGATQSLVYYLQQMFDNNIRVIVPQIAMSAGTMIACSSKEILMAKHSNLGPIDPHVNGYPAYGVIQEFKRAFAEIHDDSSKTPIWHAIISQYKPTFLSQCENAIEWSNKFVQEQLEKVMFNGDANAKDKAKRIVEALTDYDNNKTHSRHINHEECHNIGLKVQLIEDNNDLQDLILTVHHCYMHSIMNTPSFKFIENHLGVALVKQGVIQHPK